MAEVAVVPREDILRLVATGAINGQNHDVLGERFASWLNTLPLGEIQVWVDAQDEDVQADHLNALTTFKENFNVPD